VSGARKIVAQAWLRLGGIVTDYQDILDRIWINVSFMRTIRGLPPPCQHPVAQFCSQGFSSAKQAVPMALTPERHLKHLFLLPKIALGGFIMTGSKVA